MSVAKSGCENHGNLPPVCPFCSEIFGGFAGLSLKEIVANKNFALARIDSVSIRPGLLSLKSSILPRAVGFAQSGASGYRTARGSERDKDSTTCNHGGDVVLVRPNYRANCYFSLSPYPARYCSRFCTLRLVSFQTHGSRMTFEAKPARSLFPNGERNA